MQQHWSENTDATRHHDHEYRANAEADVVLSCSDTAVYSRFTFWFTGANAVP